ncbi:MAG: FG-GAP-like repeat-containing protein [Verrucomicrobiia bacterium]
MTLTERDHCCAIVCCILLWAGSLEPRASDWQAIEGGRWKVLPAGSGDRQGFTLLDPQQTGVNFTNALSEAASAANRVLLNGSGLATGDYDNDGLADIFFCSLSGSSALYRNLGDLRFENVTRAAGIELDGQITRGAVFADINGDGWKDLLISTLATGVTCLINDGNGKFHNITAAAGTASRFGSVTMALADIDGNGTLDLYVSNYRGDDIRDRGRVNLLMVKGKMVVPDPLKDRLLVVGNHVIEYGEPDQLLLNLGQGRFAPVSWTGGTFRDEDGKPLTGPPLDWGLTATFRDMNADGFPDIYVCNDYWTPDRIWMNDGKGQFRAIERLALRQSPSSSMGIDFADIDRDGHLDFIATDMLSRDPQLRKRQMPARWPIPEPIQVIEHRAQIIQNSLFHNRGDGTYEELANYSGVAASEWTWQPLFMDVDLDGFEDLLVSAGHARDVQDMDAEREIRMRQHSWKGFTLEERQKAFTQELMTHMRLYPGLAMPIFTFRNTGQLRFDDATSRWGTSQPGVHHCMATADLDNDGDLDLVVNNLRAVAGVYRNDSTAPRVAVRLEGLAPNTSGIGAVITLLDGAVPIQSREVICGGSYMSGSDTMLVFAAGSAAKAAMTLEVRWRSGRRSRISNVIANRLYEVDEQAAKPGAAFAKGSASANKNRERTLFEDATATLAHTHQDAPFDDLARQPLLPRLYSQGGPGVTWFDLNGDGWDDLLIAAGRGGKTGAFLNDQRGGFNPVTGAPFDAPVTRDQTAILGVVKADGQPTLVVGSSNFEDGLAAGPSARLFNLAQKRIEDNLPGQLSSTGPVAVADLEGDGDLDLFIGGRCIPGRHPEPASSLILRQASGTWVLDSENTRTLRGAGLVTAAVWSDLDGDGLPELVLACEWGPIRVFANKGGVLRDQTAELGFAKHTGWWSGVAAGDLNGDGLLDLVAANWGLNSLYQATDERPLRLYFGDIAGRGVVDLVEAEYDPGIKEYAPRRRLDELAPAIPFLAEMFPTHKAFSEANIARVLGAKLSATRIVQASTLASMVFMNRGGRFEAVELPREAQFAPGFGVVVADFNGDGREDVFLSQNFFDTAAETPRLDAGRGLLLLGDGTGKVRAVPGQESGIRVYGEQRGAAVADYNRDGRADLVVAQNNAATRLFRNTGAAPGLRVRLRGPTGNPAGIGAALRLYFGDVAGPVREIQAGSGYWSQNSSVQVFGTPQPPSKAWVRWPGGKVTTTALEKPGPEIVIDSEGKLVAGGSPQ